MTQFENLKSYYPFEMEEIKNVSMKKIGEMYLSLLEKGRKEGFIPIFLVFDEILEEKFELSLEDNELEDMTELVKIYLEEAQKKSAAEFFKNKLNEYNDEEDDCMYQMIEDAFSSDYSVPAEEKNKLELSTLFDYENNLLKDNVILVKLPTKNPYEALAYIPMGGFNDCPLPSEQVAVCKYWYEKYGAIPAVITYDTVEFFVERPVNTLEETKNLAIEQFLFCSDLGTQTCDNIEEIADFIHKNIQWYFWWD